MTIALPELVMLRMVVENHRIDLTNEKRTQADLEAAFTAAELEFEREKRLSSADIPDFMIGSIAVEVKIGGSAREILRQLKRYAAHDAVSAILLATNVAMSLPSEIDGKPARTARLGVAWI